MVIDTSVLVHAAFRESGWRQSLHLLSRQPRLLLSSVSLVETHVVVRSRSSEDAEAVIDELPEALRVEVTPFGTAQASLARRALNLYGKGQAARRSSTLGALSSTHWPRLALRCSPLSAMTSARLI